MSSIKLNFIYNVILNISKIIFPLITAPYVARILNPDGMGLYNFAINYANYFALFAVLGTSLYGIRGIAKRRDSIQEKEKFISEILSITIISTAIFSVLYIISLFVVGQLREECFMFIVAGLVLYITPLKIEWYYSGCEKFGFIAIRSLTIKIISVVGLFVFVHDKNDVINYVALTSLALILNELWNYIMLIRSGIRPHFTLLGLKKHIKSLFVLLFSSIAISIYTVLDILMLGFMTNYGEVGYYNAATQFSSGLLPIVTSLSAVSMPRISYYIENKKYADINILANKSISFVSFLALPLTLSLYLIAPVFVPLFFGADFAGAIIPLQIISILLTVVGLNNLMGIQLLIGLGHDKLFFNAIVCGTILSFCLNLFLIPAFGASGAAISSIAAQSLVLVVVFIFVQKKTFIQLTGFLSDVIKSFFVMGLFIPLFSILSSNLSGWYLIAVFTVVGSLLYVSLLVILRHSIAIKILLLIKNIYTQSVSKNNII